jgi:hypothetical protein
MNDSERTGFETVQRSLECRFTDEEKIEMSQQLAVETQNKRRLEDQKKSVTSQYSSQINEKAESINTLSDKIASGYEFRNIECEVEWHTPFKNKKMLMRTDTNESWVENMTEYDHNLFNQYQEKLAADKNEEDANEYNGEDEF